MSRQVSLEVISGDRVKCPLYGCMFTGSDDKEIFNHLRKLHGLNLCEKHKLLFGTKPEKKRHFQKLHSIE